MIPKWHGFISTPRLNCESTPQRTGWTRKRFACAQRTSKSWWTCLRECEMSTAEEYQTAASTLFDQAMVELDAGDSRQASEKLWGAAAQALKSLAERRGWRHGSHREFYRIMKRLDHELDESELTRNRFNAATQLHVNFYENWLRDDEIRARAIHVQALVSTLGRL